jgi:hypothetical protein
MNFQPSTNCSDIAWAGALASHAHIERKPFVGACVRVRLDTATVGESWAGVRPSSGAAICAALPTSILHQSGLAAPEDGRAPAAVSRCTPCVIHDDCWFDEKDYHPYKY